MGHHPQRERIRPFCALVERVARAGEHETSVAKPASIAA
jgi:hypothetical protein